MQISIKDKAAPRILTSSLSDLQPASPLISASVGKLGYTPFHQMFLFWSLIIH
ncbi:MAG: hypothetical protein LBU32_13455 [Clostridiales bacterium]|nr:hypothetical protein [Clostridiales bacterium]